MTASASTAPHRAVPRSVFDSAWALPVLVVGQFAFVGLVPVALLAIGTIRRVTDRGLRILAGVVTASYLAPFLIWILNPERARSLSKDIDPVFIALIIASSLAFVTHAVRVGKR